MQLDFVFSINSMIELGSGPLHEGLFYFPSTEQRMTVSRKPRLNRLPRDFNRMARKNGFYRRPSNLSKKLVQPGK
jgi:hypothetical protein